MQAEIFFFAHDNLTDARERPRDRTVGLHGVTGRVPHARVGLTIRVHVTVLVEVVALTRRTEGPATSNRCSSASPNGHRSGWYGRDC